MKIFSIELSSRFGSVALIENGAIVLEKSWEETFKNRQQLFDAIAGLGVDWESVDYFAAGRGPGAFSGMRISFTVVNTLAAPDKKPVYALNSGAPLVAQVAAPRTAVVGDARRDKVWAGVFSGTELEKEFTLMERDELRDFIPADTVVVSPDQDRLVELLSDFETLDKPVFPTAGKLGELVAERLKNGVESEPFEPLYMHPPVFIEPRFPS